ncbi:MAG: hypothetical protein A2V46_09185 [Bacteroidetes bacterium RBG_19FT_COMBO_42_7]|nr:MAG: hypothetical protein A2Y71_13715 [Bacteroidetes bacterium RBG_13_42_15]OFY83245.1 MAG: hypothetical protein A2V46_09185 [Bacteroidetes bacterium RBG_19FT_COMBO_42_7]
MEKLISCCGLNCAACDARIATVKDDDELRKAVADKWRVAYNVPGLSYEMINCTGCREEGVKFSHCDECEIRNCVKVKGFNTCGDCQEMQTCSIVASVHKYVPEAITNLQSLN